MWKAVPSILSGYDLQHPRHSLYTSISLCICFSLRDRLCCWWWCFWSWTADTWLKYCRYGVKLYPINQSIIVVMESKWSLERCLFTSTTFTGAFIVFWNSYIRVINMYTSSVNRTGHGWSDYMTFYHLTSREKVTWRQGKSK